MGQNNTSAGQSGDSAPGLDKMLEGVDNDPGASTSTQGFLVVIAGEQPGRVHALDRQELVIGRSKYADIRIRERALSQQHAKLVQVGETHRLYDLGSTNGTFVNDSRIDQAELKPGDLIRMGETVFSYMSSAGDPAISDATMALPTTTARLPPMAGRGGALVPVHRQVPAPVHPVPQVVRTPGEDGQDFITLLMRLMQFSARHRMMLVALTVFGFVCGGLSFLFFRPPSIAEFRLQLNQRPSDNPIERGRRMNFEFFGAAPEKFTRPSLIEESLRQLGEADITPRKLRQVQKRLSFKQNRGDQVYVGSFEASTAQEAIDFLRTHLRLFIDTEIESALKVLVVEVETLQEKRAEMEAELKATEQKLAEFKQQNTEALPEQEQQLYETLIALGMEKGRVHGEVARAAADVQLSKRQLKSSVPLTETRVAQAQPYENAIAEVRQELATARASGKGARHPDVIKLQSELANFEKLRDQAMREGTRTAGVDDSLAYKAARDAVGSSELALKVAQAELHRLNNDYEKTRELIEKLPRLQREYSELTRSYEKAKEVHANLFEQLRTSSTQLDLERAQAQTRYDLIVPPNIKPASSLKTIVVRSFGFGFLGLLIAVSIGLFLDLLHLVAARSAQTKV